MEHRKVLDMLAYYFSEYDMQAFNALGFSTQTKGFDETAPLFGKKGSYLRRLRDEYDVVTNSIRRGQCNRPPRDRIIQTSNYLSSFSFDELTEIIRAFLGNSSVGKTEVPSDKIGPVLSEEELESILNFKDAGATIRVRTTDNVVRVYNVSIIKQLKHLYGGCCQLCGARAFPDFDVDVNEAHHIAYFSRSQNNDASNIIVLCPNHHRLVHKCNPLFDAENGRYVFSDGQTLDLQLNYHLGK